MNTNQHLNVFIKGVENETAQQLEQSFQENFGEVKSAKVSRSAQMIIDRDESGRKQKKVDITQPPKSNGYGFVCFQSQEDAEKAIKSAKLGNLEVIRYQPKDPREARKVYNNIYVKDFSPEYTAE